MHEAVYLATADKKKNARYLYNGPPLTAFTCIA